MTIIYSFFGLLICGGSILIFIVILIAIYQSPSRSLVNKDSSDVQDNFKFVQNKYLISRAERKFYVALYRVLKTTDHIAFPKVRLADVISLPKGTHNSLVYQETLKLKSEQIDFLICNRITLKPILAIVITEKKRHLNNQEEEDFIIKALTSAKISVLKTAFQLNYDLDQLKKNIHELTK